MNTLAQSGNILIVDNEASTRRALEALLTCDGHSVQTAGEAEEALSLLAGWSAEVVLVDIRLPGRSGLALLRAAPAGLAVIFLAHHGTFATAREAIRAGAHDYLLKSAAPDEIRSAVARALAAVRKARAQQTLLNEVRAMLAQLDEAPTGANGREVIRCGDLKITPGAHTVSLAGEELALTPAEYRLLLALARRKGDVVDYVSLVADTLAYETNVWEAKDLIKRHVFTLRQKIAPDSDTVEMVRNVRGIGYRLDSDCTQA